MHREIGGTGSPHSLVFPAVKAGRKRAPGSTVTSFNCLNAAQEPFPGALEHAAGSADFSCLPFAYTELF